MNESLSEHLCCHDKSNPRKTVSSMSGNHGVKNKHRALLTIIVPVYNEQDGLENCYKRINAVADTLTINTEIMFINDGSSDTTLELIYNWQKSNKRISVIDLSRNFGKEIAMTAGLDYARGDAVIIIDADLQDPPELIPQMVSEWQHGYDIVYMKRESRQGETWMKKITAHGFYYIINRISQVEMPQGVGDFRLLNRRAVDSICQLRESGRFMKGLFAWLGFKQKEILYHRDERASGNSKWSYLALWNLAIDGITSFSTAPLKLASYVGIFSILISVFCFFWLATEFVVDHQPPSSLSLIATGFLFFGGLQMIFMGIMGEYLGRLYLESKKRPLYLINAEHPSEISEEEYSCNYSENSEKKYYDDYS